MSFTRVQLLDILARVNMRVNSVNKITAHPCNLVMDSHVVKVILCLVFENMRKELQGNEC